MRVVVLLKSQDMSMPQAHGQFTVTVRTHVEYAVCVEEKIQEQRGRENILVTTCDVDLGCPGSAEAPKGWTVRPLKPHMN